MNQNDLTALRMQALTDSVPSADAPGLRVYDDGTKGPSLTVEHYLRLRSGALRSNDRLAADLLRARVYHVDATSYATYYRCADVWAETAVFGADCWRPADHGSYHPDGPDVEGALDLARLGAETPLTGLPFPDLYIGFGSGIELSENHIEARANLDSNETVVSARIMAIHVVNSDYVYEHINVETFGGLRAAAYVCRAPGEKTGVAAWTSASALMLVPWVTLCLLSAVERHGTTTSKTVAERVAKRRHKRTGERLRPPRFYTVRTTTVLDKVIVDEVMSESTQRTGPSYRFDVRGHWRLLTKRSTEGLLTKDRLALESRGYTVGTNATELGPDIVQALLDRGLSLPSDGEWVACKLTRVKSHQKGPEDGEYIPAVRTA